MELRCDNGILYGVIAEQDELEVRCRSARCGHEAGVVVLHKFNIRTGKLVKTSVFADPKGKGETNDTRTLRSAVRSA